MLIRGARWRKRLARSAAIVKVKQLSQWSVIGWVTKNLLSRAPPCYERHVKPLVPVASAVVSTRQSALGPRAPAPTQENGCDTKLFDLARSVHWIVDDDGITTVANKVSDISKEKNMDNDPNKDIARPDPNQMIPYKPKINPLPGEHPISGGSFPLPPAAAHLCTLMPPPSSCRGPFVHVDKLMHLFNRISLPDKPRPHHSTEKRPAIPSVRPWPRSWHWVVDDDGITAVATR
ncbi:hypothetical protein evm_014983 [Chilo suppressalis]|nr:hypothetical protein evm_014983 [Chilo suppressalis]